MFLKDTKNIYFLCVYPKISKNIQNYPKLYFWKTYQLSYCYVLLFKM